MEQNRNTLASAESDGDSAHGSLAVTAAAGPARVTEYDSATGTFVTRPAPAPPQAEPVALRARHDGWTPERQRRFLEELADCGIVQEAAARVGMSRQSAWQLRRRSEGTAFGLAFEVALQAGLQSLHSIAFTRAVEGVPVPVFYRGEQVGERRAYDNRLLLSLIAGAGRPAESWRATLVRRDWDSWLDAVEQGRAAPAPRLADAAAGKSGGAGNPVWADEAGTWWTRYPPPAGAAVTEEGGYGDPDYRRTLTGDERAALEAAQAARRDRAAAERDSFFGLQKRFEG